MPEHGVEDNEQLAHAGCEGQLLGLTSGQQPLVEASDDGVVTAGTSGSVGGMAQTSRSNPAIGGAVPT